MTEQNTTCQRQGHLSAGGVRTGSKKFLPPDHILPSREALGEPCYCSGPEHPALFLPSNRWERGHHLRSCREVWVRSRTHAVPSPFPSGKPFPGQCAASHHPCAWERGPRGTDCAPRRQRMALAPLPSYTPVHPRTEFCNGSASQIAAPIFPSSTP